MEFHGSKAFQQNINLRLILLPEFIITVSVIFLNSTYLSFSSSSKEGNTYMSSISSLRTCVILGKASLLMARKRKKNTMLINSYVKTHLSLTNKGKIIFILAFCL